MTLCNFYYEKIVLCCAVSFNYEQEKDLCSGPSKLCESLYISKEEINEADLTESSMIWLEGMRDFLNNDTRNKQQIFYYLSVCLS